MTDDDPVTAQYARWRYPDPALGEAGRTVWNDPGVYAALFWPDRPPPAVPRILVAGCGTSEAPAMARANPGAEVVGIDVSQPSLDAAQKLSDELGLRNLRLFRLPIEQVESLGRTFDAISCGGVLHHLANPAQGLAALGRVLAPHGVVSGAVYGLHARAGAYLLQQAFAAAGLKQTEEDVALVRELLPALPAQHPARAWMGATGAPGPHDAHVVDAFLNARDTAYDVAGVLQLVADAGMAFQGWFYNAPYHPDALLTPPHPLATKLRALEGATLWSTMERLTTPLDHCFLACRTDRPRASYGIDFTAADLLDWTVGRRFPDGVRHPPIPYDPRDTLQDALYRQLDGVSPLRACLARAGVQGPPDEIESYVRGFLRHLWRKDAIYVRLPDGR